MVFARLSAFVALALLAAACLPVTTTTPVGTTTGLSADPALTGMWKGHGDKPSDTIYAFFFPQSGATTSAVLLRSAAKDGGWGHYTFETTTLGQYKFMNAHEISSDGKPSDAAAAQKTFPLLYRVNGDGALVIYLVDEKRAKAAIKAGKIQGTIDPTDYGDVVLTAAGADLDAFLQTPDGRALFVKPLAILKKEK
ncbi:MAG TPA: hypothetical protein VGF56_16940 [Rhizomicrobium sp.]|jgi:hypothetical protein